VAAADAASEDAPKNGHSGARLTVSLGSTHILRKLKNQSGSVGPRSGIRVARREQSAACRGLRHNYLRARQARSGLESTVAAKARKALENWEIALIKAMIVAKRWNDQDILAYFTRPTRSINHARISAIRNRTKHSGIKAVASEELASFLATWPDIDPSTGLSLRGDELLLKAREAMIAAVHVFNGAGLTFRGELFIVTAIIAWTYLLHAWFKKQGVDYRYMVNVNGRKVVA
jgi:hypothetical protein